MSDADIEKAIFAEYPDLAPKAGVVDRVKNSLTSSPAADYTADDLAASVATPSKDPNAVSLPGSVMDGFVPQANDQGMPIDSGMGPMRQDYYQRERAGLLSQSLQDNSKAIEAGGQRGKIAQQVVEDKVSRMERDMSGTGQARTPQEVMDDATQNRMPELQAGDATAGDALKDVGYAATRLPWAMAAGASALVEGSDPDWGNKVVGFIRDESNKNQSMPGAKDTYLLGITRDKLRNLPENLAFSLFSMGAGIAAGASSAPGGPLAMYGAGAAASGLAAYRMDTNGFMRDVRDKLDQASEKVRGRPFTDDEFVSVARSYEGLAREHGLYEAIPEAIGNVIGFHAGKLIFENAKLGLAGITKSIGAGYMELAGEAGTEAWTQMGQHNVEVKGGLSNDKMRSWTSPADWNKSMQEVLPDVVLLTGVMGAGTHIAGRLTTDNSVGAQIARELQRSVDGSQFNPDAIDRTAVSALSPYSNGAGFLRGDVAPHSPVVPRATPADVANAATPEAAATAIADMGAGLAPAATESLASTQAEIDALLSDPIIEAAAAPNIPDVPVQPIPDAQAGPVPSVADFIAQGTNGRWSLSRPIDNQPPETVAVIIAELDRLNAARAAPSQEVAPPSTKAEPTPQPAKGTVRYYHGGSPEGVDGPLWFTSDRNDANGWASRSPGMRLWYVDIPEGDTIRGGDPEFGVIPPSRIELPPEIASKRALLVDGKAEPAPAGAQPTTGGQDGQGQKTAEVLTPPAAANPVSAAAADQESRLQEQYQKAQTEANDPRLTDGERKLAATKAEQALDALGDFTQGEAKSITRIKGGKLRITGYAEDDVTGSLPKAIADAVTITFANGEVAVAMKDGSKMPIRTENAIKKALTGAGTARAPKKRTMTGNLRNDINILAPGLYAEVARGGDGEGLANFDMSLIAERLRDEGFMLPNVDTGKDSDAVIELIRQDIANGGGTLNEARATAALEEESAKKHRQDVLRMASEYGVETKRGIIPRRLEDVEADLEAAIEDELGVSGRGAVSAYDAAIAAGISEKEADAIIDKIAEGYTGDTARDAWVRQYRDQANALQEAIDAKEREGRTPEAEDAAETPVEAEERPALELAGQTEAEARADEERLILAEQQAAREAESAARKEAKAKEDAERQARMGTAAESFDLTAQVNDKSQQKKADKAEIDRQFAGQGDIFSQQANEAATSPTNDRPAPTPAQMEAGNYKKGHIQLHGFDISIENPRGSERVAKDGSWRVPSMPSHYGYIKGTVGADKDHLDVFVGPNPESTKAWVINQVVADSSPAKFDEHKVMLGFDSAEDAKRAYLDSFDGDYGPRVFGSMTEALTIEELKAKIEDGELSHKKFAGPVISQATGGRADPVAESQAPAPSEPGNEGVAPIQDGAAAVFEYDGIVPGFPSVLYRMGGNWYRDIGGGKLEVTGQRNGDIKLAEFMARYPQEWVANGEVEVRNGRITHGGGRIIDVNTSKQTPAGILEFAKGKTVTRQAMIAETGQAIELKNQDAVEVLTELRRDIDALEALKLCIGA